LTDVAGGAKTNQVPTNHAKRFNEIFVACGSGSGYSISKVGFAGNINMKKLQ
jgi:hypothetical protein